MRRFIIESDGHVITLRVPSQPREDVPRVVRTKPVLALFDARHDLSDASADVLHLFPRSRKGF